MKSRRVALVFAFGLLHGLGFAGALKDIGLPRSEFLAALVSFNVGVELGQLAVIAAAFLLVGWHCADRPWYRRKQAPSFLDMLTTLRQAGWRCYFSGLPLGSRQPQNSLAAWPDAVLATA